MNIQGKPASAQETNPALEAFRDGKPLAEVAKAAEAATAATAAKAPAPKTEEAEADIGYSAQNEIAMRALKQRISKTTRISQYNNLCLREYSAERTKQEGEKVSESDILDEALGEYWKKRKFALK